MLAYTKQKVKQLLPARFFVPAKNLILQRKAEAARKAYHSISDGPAYLGMAELKTLHKKYPFPPDYGYDPASTAKRGEERARDVISALPKAARTGRSLELGCSDGMLSLSLKHRGFAATAIDLSNSRFDERAPAGRVDLRQMDAEQLDFPDASFDLAVSFNAFEHFPDPQRVFKETLRVVRPGGYIYLSFGPLYMSPYGLHAYRNVTVPYCQHLWTREVLEQFTQENGLGDIPFESVNGWTLQQYREVWAQASNLVEVVSYLEVLDAHGIELIEQHPSCFRSKTGDFKSLLVGTIIALFRGKA